MYQVIPVAMKRCSSEAGCKKRGEKKVERWQTDRSQCSQTVRRRGISRKWDAVRLMHRPLKMAEELDVVLIPYELAEGMEETKQIIQRSAGAVCRHLYRTGRRL